MRTLIIDSDYVGHRVKYGCRGLKFSQGDEEFATGVIYAFLKAILEYSNMFQTNRIIFVWDSRKSRRRLRYPWYKNRTDILTEEEKELNKIARDQFKALRTEILPAIGFRNNFMRTGFEGDDLIAKIVMSYDLEFEMITSDEDLFMMISPTCAHYSPGKKERMDDKAFRDKYNIDPGAWRYVKALAGCNSDTVPGIFKVGEITAIKYLNKKLKPHLQTYKDITSPEGEEIFMRNMWLVSLPLEDTPEIELQDDQFSMKGFKQITRKYGLHSFRKTDWAALFQMEKAQYMKAKQTLF